MNLKILDGPAIAANMHHPVSDCKTCIQYAKNVFIPFILNSQLSTVQIIDIIWERYFEKSLKAGTRRNRGLGVRRKVATNGILPSNFKML